MFMIYLNNLDELSYSAIYEFLLKADKLFPVPISQKCNLLDYSLKLHEKATVCAFEEKGKIVAMVAGYTENTENNLAYIAIVAALKQVQRKGIITKLLTDFFNIAKEKRLDAVHLYTCRENDAARSLYQKLGFVEWHPIDEKRSEDLHLIYYLSNSCKE